jgi:hypothetical protein
MKLVNLTPHDIVLRDPCGVDHTIPPSGSVARVTSQPGIQTDILADYGGVPIYSAPVQGEVEGLPARNGDAIYIVSQVVAVQVPERLDVVSPGTGPLDGAIREGGRIVAVTRLVSAAEAQEEHCIYCGASCGVVCIATGHGGLRSGWDCPSCGAN